MSKTRDSPLKQIGEFPTHPFIQGLTGSSMQPWGSFRLFKGLRILARACDLDDEMGKQRGAFHVCGTTMENPGRYVYRHIYVCDVFGVCCFGEFVEFVEIVLASQEARTIKYQRFLVPIISCTSAMAVLLTLNIPSWWLCTFPRLLLH